MKKIAFFIVIAVFAFGQLREQGASIPGFASFSNVADSDLQEAFQNQQSNLQVRGQGIVVKVLPDDLDGSRHQKFVLKIGTGQTLLISHNIDLAPRVDGLREGDSVAFYGEYEWNSKGGVIHWTHHDPKNLHIGGWLKHQGRTYQ